MEAPRIARPAPHSTLARCRQSPEGEQSHGKHVSPIATYYGPAGLTDAKKFQKVEFANRQRQAGARQTGQRWLDRICSITFVSAWLPANNQAREYFHPKSQSTLFQVGHKVAPCRQ